MKKRLVRYIDWHFAEVDPVRLKRTAKTLRNQILAKIRIGSDQYGFYTITLPIVDAAIRADIVKSLGEDDVEVIPANYRHDKTEGLLPAEFDRDFIRAVADFSVTVQGVPLEAPELLTQNGETFGWVEFEEEGDWPHNLKFP